MPLGRIISSGLANHPESNRELMRLVTDAPVREREVWIEPHGPIPPFGTLVTWAGRHVRWTGPDGREAVARKREYADDPDAHLA